MFKKNKTMRKKYFLLTMAVLFIFSVKSQDTATIRQKAPHVFIDCKSGCDTQFLRAQLNYLNHVRDMRMADVYIMVTSLSNGSGGVQYTLHTTNEKNMKEDSIVFSTPPNASDGNIRELLLKKIKSIVLPYLISTMPEFIDYNITMEKKDNDAGKVKDKWNFWTANINLNGSGGGQSYSTNYNCWGYIGINRTTEKSKFEISAMGSYNYQYFNFNGTTVEGNRNSYGFGNVNAFSIGKHFSAGYFLSYISSSATNLRGNSTFFPGIEYNVFPYDKATRKALRILYRVGVRYQDYYTPTIYDNTYLLLYPHSLVIDYIHIEKWGSIDITLAGTHYLNKSDYYNVNINPVITLNPFKGFKLSFWGNYTFVNDQFYLPKENATDSQVLLNQKQLKTTFTFYSGVGISYSFGSIYNNVVNVRFNLDRNLW